MIKLMCLFYCWAHLFILCVWRWSCNSLHESSWWYKGPC